MNALALLILSIVPREDVVRETVDLVEVNHFYDDQGRLVFDQTIFYSWSQPHERYMVKAWRLVKKPEQLPQYDWRSKSYLAVWFDGDIFRRVSAPMYRESWTQHDPELAEREYLPKEKRSELLRVEVRQ